MLAEEHRFGVDAQVVGGFSDGAPLDDAEVEHAVQVGREKVGQPGIERRRPSCVRIEYRFKSPTIRSHYE
ncbi:hypothetical protein AXK57_16960 [Tsukamurella pulmonis]|uniref:Uncharacterized protein n=1 Tax=Tsukamurella pulmonis TaxID=47312 RepID=A0A1H1AWB8_9ACTN|nr:hypothetical protein AXK56_22220 [Tsukamurella pulmonis]KXP08161.1 hypothetical protein AXK57_16960 [Tsukamurella pulmonis]SDQ43995.1 hypothetical protein SAMN04489765_0417 [Tsukamurella pulmonis]SUP26003.1 Uncharacterised protein [Tsukamurella pulmonis]